MTEWPWEGDSPSAKLRLLAGSYRALALLSDPDGTAKLDRLAAQWGETWIVPHRAAYDEDDLISTREAAAILCIKPNSVSKLVGRGRLATYPYHGHKRYRAGDVYALVARIRGRNQK